MSWLVVARFDDSIPAVGVSLGVLERMFHLRKVAAFDPGAAVVDGSWLLGPSRAEGAAGAPLDSDRSRMSRKEGGPDIPPCLWSVRDLEDVTTYLFGMPRYGGGWRTFVVKTCLD